MQTKRDEHPASSFLKSLYSSCKRDGFIHVLLIDRAGHAINKFVPIKEINSIPIYLKTYRGYNVFFGVATRGDEDSSKDGIIEIPCLYVEIDLTDKFGVDLPEKKEILQRLKDFQLTPSFINNSGGGLHVYWKFKTPFLKSDIPLAENLLKRLAFYFGGDKSSTDASHNLRLPGTWNFKPKYKTPRKVTIEEANPENEYSPDDFEATLPENTSTEDGRPHLPEGWEKELLSGVEEGERNNTITRLTGRYLGKNLSREEILPILLDANSRFKPPLPLKEIEACLDSILKTDKRNHPESSPSKEKSTPSWPSPLAQEAFYGLAGDFVNLIQPHTESDPVAVLVQFLSAMGNIIGPIPHFKVEADKHSLKINPVLVGETAKARKGTSTGYIKNVFKQIDSKWRITGGLSSGEGLIWQVRDEIKKSEPIREKGRVTGEYQEFVIDPGIEDKRLFVIEEEFASPLRLMGRDGNILSPIIRRTWDDGNLECLTKNSPAKSTGAHISIVAHITKDELKRYLDRTETGNGFANRFIWLCVRRSKTLPHGGKFYDLNLEPMLSKLRECIEFGRSIGEIRRDDKADQFWGEVYPSLSEGKPGLLGAVISRGEAQVMRIACIYAVLDKSKMIREKHLLAALALWDYSEASARFIFGDATGDLVADRILQAVRGKTLGLTRTEIRDLFFRHASGEKIDLGISFLEKHNLIRMAKEDTRGRPVERWVVV